MKLTKKSAVIGAVVALLVSAIVFFVVYFNCRSNATNFNLNLEETNIQLDIGEQKSVAIEVDKSDVEISFTTISTNSNIILATMTDNHLNITAVNEGSATIVLKAKYKDETKTARCNVVVSKPLIFDFQIDDMKNCEFANNTLNCFDNYVRFRVVVNGLSADKTPDIKVLSGDITCTKEVGYFTLCVNEDGKIAIFADGEDFEFEIAVKILV